MEHLRATDQREQPARAPRGTHLRASAGRLMRLKAFRIVAVLALVAPGTLRAQQKKADPPVAAARIGRAQIVGMVIDSLNGTYLSGAEVVIEGAKTTLFTDSLGRFRVDSLPPGTYQLGVFHPLLDTLGISLTTQPF